MKPAALVLTFFALLAPAHAHDPDIATFVLRPVAAAPDGAEAAKGWVLDVHVAQAALVRAVGQPSDPKRWREAAVAYLRRHIRLTVDGAPIAFGGGGIKVGGHQTDARLLYALPDGATVDVTIDAFTDDGHQSNVLKLRGAAPRTIVLGDDAGYTARLTLRR